MQQLENDLDQVQEALLTANNQLEEKDKALANVSLGGIKYKKCLSFTTQFLSGRGGSSLVAEKDAADGE